DRGDPDARRRRGARGRRARARRRLRPRRRAEHGDARGLRAADAARADRARRRRPQARLLDHERHGRVPRVLGRAGRLRRRAAERRGAGRARPLRAPGAHAADRVLGLGRQFQPRGFLRRGLPGRAARAPARRRRRLLRRGARRARALPLGAAGGDAARLPRGTHDDRARARPRGPLRRAALGRARGPALRRRGSAAVLGFGRKHDVQGGDMKLVFAALVALAAAHAARAQEPAADYPSRAVRLVVPNAPGSSIDTMSRIVTAKLGETLGQSVFVENRDGAGGLIGVEAAKTTKPDGDTLLCASNGSMMIAPLLRKPVPYDAIDDFTLIGPFAVTPNVLVVNPEVPVNSVKELIDYAKAHASTINMASAGVDSQSHLSGVLLMTMAGFESLHVPHKGGGPSVNSVVAGQTHWTLTPAPAAMSFVRNGKLRALGQSLP